MPEHLSKLWLSGLRTKENSVLWSEESRILYSIWPQQKRLVVAARMVLMIDWGNGSFDGIESAISASGGRVRSGSLLPIKSQPVLVSVVAKLTLILTFRAGVLPV